MGLPDETVVEMIRRKLDAGVLPRQRTLRLWASVGQGQTCQACERPIDPPDVVYEIEVCGRTIADLHRRCHILLQEELERRGWHGGD